MGWKKIVKSIKRAVVAVVSPVGAAIGLVNGHSGGGTSGVTISDPGPISVNESSYFRLLY